MMTPHRIAGTPSENRGSESDLARVGLGLCILAWAALLTGCGYSMSRPFPSNVDELAFDEAAEADDAEEVRRVHGKIRTVFVEPIRSKEFRRELEMRLTEAVAKRIEVDTPYRISSKERADTILSGEILEVRQSVFGTDFLLDRPRETATTFLIALRWRHPGTGKILVERKVYTETDTWVPPVGETFFKGSDRVINRLAERIVEQMETVW